MIPEATLGTGDHSNAEQHMAMLWSHTSRQHDQKSWGHDLSEFYEGGLEKGGFSKLNSRKVRRRPGGGGRTNIEGLRRA